MNQKRDLVLDMAGVLATNFSPMFWEDLSFKFEVSYEELMSFRQEMRSDLWTGKMEEHEFWMELQKRFPTIDRVYAKNKLLSTIKPLPALAQIPTWSQVVNIHLLSNHRIDWIHHIIAPVEAYLKSITISANVGLVKPQPAIYSLTSCHFKSKDCVLFIDDQEKNLSVARSLGWNTILADAKGEWINTVNHQLSLDTPLHQKRYNGTKT